MSISVFRERSIKSVCIDPSDLNSVLQGMQTFDQALFDLYESGEITYEDALKHADSANDLRLMIKLDKNSAKWISR